MAATLKLGDVTVDVLQKDIKHLHLTVHPPEGRVRIAAPLRMKLDTIRVYAISKLPWIRQQQRAVVSGSDQGFAARVAFNLGTASWREGRVCLRSEDADQTGERQSRETAHPTHHGPGEESVECLEYMLVHELVHLLEPTRAEASAGSLKCRSRNLPIRTVSGVV